VDRNTSRWIMGAALAVLVLGVVLWFVVQGAG